VRDPRVTIVVFDMISGEWVGIENVGEETLFVWGETPKNGVFDLTGRSLKMRQNRYMQRSWHQSDHNILCLGGLGNTF